MVKKKNHKIFNLIIMIILAIICITIPSISLAVDDEESEITENAIEEAKETELVTDDEQGSLFTSKSGITEKDPETGEIKTTANSKTLFSTINNNEFAKEMKMNVAKWYYIFRYASIAIMLVVLLVLGIKLAISSIAEKKALYKRMLVDWVVSFVLLFSIHYFMIFVLYINETIIDLVRKVSEGVVAIGSGAENSLYESVRSRAYETKLSVGFAGMLMYMALIYYTIRYIIIYTKRYITLVILTIMAPIVILLDSLKKVFTGKGKAKVLSTWIEEYAMNVLLQAVHAIVYTVFIGMAFQLSGDSLIGCIFALIVLSFMPKIEPLIRKILRFSSNGGLANENASADVNDLKDLAMTGMAVNGVVKGIAGNKVQGRIGEMAKTGVAYAGIGLGWGVKALGEKTGINGKLSALGEKINDKIDDKYQDKINKTSAKYQSLYNTAAAANPKQRAKLLKSVAKAGKKANAAIKRKESYHHRRAWWGRVRDVLDPETYLEYDRYKNDIQILNSDGTTENYKKGDIKGKRLADGTILAKRKIIRTKRRKDGTTKWLEDYAYRSVFTRAKEARDAIWGLSRDDRKVLKNVKDSIKSGALGIGGMVLGMGSVVANPTLGFALLASNASDASKLLFSKRGEGLQVNRRMRRRINKIRKTESKEAEKELYKFNRFSTKSLISIDGIIRDNVATDPTVDAIEKVLANMDSGRLKYKIAMLPFTLTGTRGVLRNSMKYARATAVQHKKDIIDYEIGVTTETFKSTTVDTVEMHKKVIQEVEEIINNKRLIELVADRKRAKGLIFDVNGKTYSFTGSGNGVFTEKERLTNVLIEAALNMGVYDFGKLDFNNSYTMKRMVDSLRSNAFIDEYMKKNKINKIEDFVKKDLKLLRNDLALNNSDLIKKRLYQTQIATYMKIHNLTLDQLDDVKKKEIQNEYLKKINQSSTDDSLKTLMVSIVAQTADKKLSTLSLSEAVRIISSDRSSFDVFSQNVKADRFNAENIVLVEALNGTPPNLLNAVKVKKALSDLGLDTSQNSLDKVFEDTKTKMDKQLSKIIIESFASDSIINISGMDIDSVPGVKENILNRMRFSGYVGTDDELTEIAQAKVYSNDIIPDDIEDQIIKDATLEYIEKNYDGDVNKYQEAMKDSAKQSDFEEYIMNKLEKPRDEQKDNINNLLEQIKGESTVENPVIDISTNQVEEMSNYGYPEIAKRKINSDSIDYLFKVPNDPRLANAKIEVIELSSSGSKWQERDNIELLENTIFAARIIMDGKVGPSLVLKYPVNAGDVVDKLKGSSKKTDEELRDESTDDIEKEAFDSLEMYNQSAENKEIHNEMAKDATIAGLFRNSEKIAANNNVDDVINSLLEMEPKVDPKNQEVLDIVNESRSTLRDIRNNPNPTEESDAHIDELIKLLLQEKQLNDDAASLKIHKKVKKQVKYMNIAKKQEKDMSPTNRPQNAIHSGLI